ncbi:hypothetical protein DSL72_005073 [Monilinia vaccinii-corymbosi]|uniref:Uncharacterized protein n=1 Tax=Monilinia vaccinii-corymbosi TaxID=61207 RepID=A0A8A3PEK6_9HELO|nr:hypothetical protein DSL72_005073 [Monilinia vaccinii-corymbosi]
MLLTYVLTYQQQEVYSSLASSLPAQQTMNHKRARAKQSKAKQSMTQELRIASHRIASHRIASHRIASSHPATPTIRTRKIQQSQRSLDLHLPPRLPRRLVLPARKLHQRLRGLLLPDVPDVRHAARVPVAGARGPRLDVVVRPAGQVARLLAREVPRDGLPDAAVDEVPWGERAAELSEVGCFGGGPCGCGGGGAVGHVGG